MDKNFAKAIIEKITEEQIIQILAEMNIPPYRIKDKEIWFRTICHGGDSHKLCYFRETKTFHCYTNCGSMSLFDLICKTKNLSFKESVNYLASMVHMNRRIGFQLGKADSFLLEENNKVSHKRRLRQNKNKTLEKEPIPFYEDNIMNYFEDVYYQGWIDEGITIETMKQFNIKWYEYNKHIIIPHYTLNNNLVGIRRRTLLPEECEFGKYMPECIEGKTYAHALGLNLYGLNINQEAIKRTGRVVITEAEKSVLLSNSYYGENSIAVATCGFTISNWQRDILLSLGVNEVIIAFDKDFDPLIFEALTVDKTSKEYKEYERFTERIVNIGAKFNNQCRVYALWDRNNLLQLKDSPFDRGKHIYEQLLQTKIELYLEEEDDEDIIKRGKKKWSVIKNG